ncbi:sensor histidine kinase [Fulvivirga lutimaris]|uniref:sensor histidine kinase n=1 Tax=Fulvivirga lutimaris TaxID=1819566 RepID=UPI0012BC5269|nr:sensor histidine kinase [Fulvivirga lutimaris]MTI41998.1 sensor histidine kinase [Fulvivirga lutimaris]
MESNLDTLIIIAIAGTSIFLFISGFVVFFVVFYQKRMLQKKMELQNIEAEYQRNMLQSTIDSQEKERKRIASELHDGVGAMLSAAKLNLGMLLSGAIPKEESNEAVDETKAMIDETIETVRRISKDLLPSSLEQFGISQAVEELCEKLSNPSTKISFEHFGDKIDLDVQQELLLYRITQELINNALKHAQASEIKVQLHADPISLSVVDNGVGFDKELIEGDIKKGVGLYNIENRVSLLNGELIFDTEIAKGTSITIKLAS